MRRIYGFILTVILAIVLTACGGGASVMLGDSSEYEMLLSEALLSGNSEGVSEILESDKSIDLEKVNGEGPALIEAIQMENTDLCDLLIQKGALCSGAYFEYAQSSRMVEYLLEKGFDVNEKDEEGNTPLFFLLNETDLVTECIYGERLDMLLDGGATVSSEELLEYVRTSDNCGRAADILKILQEKGEKTGLDSCIEEAVKGDFSQAVNIKSDEENRRIITKYAAAFGDLSEIRQLEKAGYDFTEPTKQGNSMLAIAAAYNRNWDAVEYFLNMDNMKNEYISCDGECFDLIAAAAIGNNFSVADRLCQIEDVDMDKLWTACVYSGNEESLEYVLGKGFKPDAEAVLEAFCDGNASCVRYCCSNTSFVSELVKASAGKQDQALSNICARDSDCLKALTDKGVMSGERTIEMAFKFHETPYLSSWLDTGDESISYQILEAAVIYGEMDIIRKAIECGCDVNRKLSSEENGEHYLIHTAAGCPSCNVLAYIVDCGAGVSCKDEEGRTPYDYAEENLYDRNMELLENIE